MLEAVGGVRIPRVVTVVIGPNDLIQREMSLAVEPASEADVVLVVLRRDFQKETLAGKNVVGWAIESGAFVVIEAVGDGVQDIVRGGAAAADDDQFGKSPGFVESDRI